MLRQRLLCLIFTNFLLLLISDILPEDKFLDNKKVTPKLSDDSKVIKMITSLEPGESVYLPEFKIIGEFNQVAKKHLLDKNGPKARDWCMKMVWMADRKRAFYCGANHGAPHRLNDAWEYDLGSNTWAMLYSPDSSKTPKESDWQDVEVKNGILQTKRGAPSMIGHLWGSITYHEIDKKVYWVSVWSGMSKKLRPKAWKAWHQSVHNPPMWSFDPSIKKWSAVPNPKVLPNKGHVGNSSVLYYLPNKKSMFYKVSKYSSMYDSSSNAYTQLKTGKPPVNSAVYTYDTKNKILVAHIGTYHYGPKIPTTWQFSVSNGTWKQVLQSKDLPNGHDGRSVFEYDLDNDVCLLLTGNHSANSPGEKYVWSYQTIQNKWTKHLLKDDSPLNVKTGFCGYFDKKYKVIVLHGNKSGSKAWIYKHSKKEVK